MDKPKKPQQPSIEKLYKQERKKVKLRISRLRKIGLDIADDILPPVPKKITQASVSRLQGLTREKIIKKAKKQHTSSAKPITPTPKPVATKSIKTRTTKPELETKQTKQKHKPSKPKPEHEKEEYTNEPDFAPPREEVPPTSSNLNLDIVNHISYLLENFDDTIIRSEYIRKKNTKNHMVLYSMWSDTLSNEDEYEVAYRLEGKAHQLNDIVQRLLYGSDSPDVDSVNISLFMELLMGRKLTSLEASQIDELQYNANINVFGGL